VSGKWWCVGGKKWCSGGCGGCGIFNRCVVVVGGCGDNREPSVERVVREPQVIVEGRLW
jgi:hypothetical protein